MSVAIPLGTQAAAPLGTQAAAALAALLITGVLVEPVRRLGLRFTPVDRPARHRAKEVRRAMPYLGGVAVAAGSLAPAAFAPGQIGSGLTIVLWAAVALTLLGLVNDLHRLGPATRLVLQGIIVWFAVVLGGVRFGLVGQEWLDISLTLALVVALTNAFSLLDSAQGVLCTVACATAVPLAASAFIAGRPSLALLLICLAAACAGLLLHNAPPARIFMGEAGSMFIGFVLAASATLLHSGRGPAAGGSMLLLITFVAAVNAGVVLVSGRLPRPHSSAYGATDQGATHVAHRLARLGLGPNALLVVFLLVTGVCGLLAVLVSGGLLPAVSTLLGAAGTALLLIVLLLQAPADPQRSPGQLDRSPLEGVTHDHPPVRIRGRRGTPA